MHEAIDEYQNYIKSEKRDLALRRALRKDVTAAAEAAAPFLHARLSSVKAGGDAENPLRTVVPKVNLSQLTDEELAALGPVLDIAAAGGDPGPGSMGPGSGPTAH